MRDGARNRPGGAPRAAPLAEALPKTEPEDKRLHDLLRKAYIEARYSKSYRITLADLTTLQGRVLELARRVRAASLDKLASLCGPDAVRPALPVPPSFDEPVVANLPPPPDDPAELAGWARSLTELVESRAREGELRGKEEGVREGELRGREAGLREDKEEGLREGKAEGLRAAVLDLCELLGLEPTDAQRAALEAMGLGELEALRQALKQQRRWPG
ncbi:MAG TPA: hypothetical protein VFS43_24275 [Polyangiaceae bacterium]|nr:hypothetical protein [Polyangiaceae bacterium]